MVACGNDAAGVWNAVSEALELTWAVLEECCPGVRLDEWLLAGHGLDPTNQTASGRPAPSTKREHVEQMRKKGETQLTFGGGVHEISALLGDEMRRAAEAGLGAALRRAAAEERRHAVGGGDAGRWVGEVSDLRSGRPEEAALGIEKLLGLDPPDKIHAMLSGDGGALGAIEREVTANGTDEDRECLQYVLHERAGSSPTLFPNAPHPRDCDGVTGRVRDDRVDPATGEGMRLCDFAALPDARLAGLSEAEVLALRLYSTAAYKTINVPLRDRARTAEHPLPVTVYLLHGALRKLRAVRAAPSKDAPAAAAAMGGMVTYRGMRNMEVPATFLAEGGTEYAPMSTTTDLNVAVRYALSRRSVLFCIKAPSFMQTGADLSFVSAFPAEAEYCYPPGCFLRPTGLDQEVELGEDSTVRVIEVEPSS